MKDKKRNIKYTYYCEKCGKEFSSEKYFNIHECYPENKKFNK